MFHDPSPLLSFAKVMDIGISLRFAASDASGSPQASCAAPLWLLFAAQFTRRSMPISITFANFNKSIGFRRV
jgi:hypothetical protein